MKLKSINDAITWEEIQELCKNDPTAMPKHSNTNLKHFVISIDSISLYSIYANACLGLRHPQNRGSSRDIAKHAIQAIGNYLVDNEVITEIERQQHEKDL